MLILRNPKPKQQFKLSTGGYVTFNKKVPKSTGGYWYLMYHFCEKQNKPFTIYFNELGLSDDKTWRIVE